MSNKIDGLPSPEELESLQMGEEEDIASLPAPSEPSADKSSKSSSEYLGEVAEGLSYGVGQGATMGFSDEIAGGIGAAGSLITGQNPEGKYTEYRDVLRKLQDQAAERSPYSYVAGQVAGGAAVPLGAGRIASAGLKTALQSPAALGAIMGAGTSENLENTPSDAVLGAALGKAGSLVGPKLGAAMGSGVSAMELTKEDPDFAKVVGAPLLGYGLGKANKAQGTAYSTGNKQLDDILNPSNFKAVKNAKEIGSDPRKLYDDDVLNQALKGDVDSAAAESAANLRSRDKGISEQFGTKLEENSSTRVDVADDTAKAIKELNDLRDLSPELAKDRDSLLNRMVELQKGQRSTSSQYKYERDLNVNTLSEKERVINSLMKKQRELEATGKVVGAVEEQDGIASLRSLDPTKQSNEQKAITSLEKRRAELLTRNEGAADFGSLDDMTAEELGAKFPTKAISGDIDGRPITLARAYEPGDVKENVLAKAFTEEAPFTPVRRRVVGELESFTPTDRTKDVTQLSPRDLKNLELEFQSLGQNAIGRGLSRDFKETANPVKDVLNQYNQSLNKKLNTAVPDIAKLNNAMRADRSYKEGVLGIENDMTPGEQASTLSTYIRNKAESLGRGAQGFESQQAGAKLDLAKISGSEEAGAYIDRLLAKPIQDYSTANKVIGAGQMPEVGLAGAMRQRARAAFAPKTISVLGHLAKNINSSQADVSRFAGNITPDVIKKGLSLGIKISEQINKIAMEKDPVRKNALIFGASQSPKHWEEIQSLKTASEQKEEP